ncbi:sigma-70 family RNA polymerase sigma factor [Paludibacter sp.]|uniref:RNA polymerase sigma factor n=1 Tax=Paludibacter sp. TaxID=1898105 RepID=UPI00135618D8|nr:sigma-70 family RNA polymerase sigma factor [Paludibacter sp.]MTK54482.1 sigma-70 family RNA polymerase sigma factor [Paludibacter sp.]
MPINLLEKTDDELVHLYFKGDHDAFAVLMSRHQDKVYTYIYLLVRNRQLAEDLFQDTFIKVVTSIKQQRYADNGKFVAWVNRIAHNLIIDYFRREQGENTLSHTDFDYDVFNNVRLSDSTVEEEMVREQLMCNVARMIDFLPDTQQEVVRMRFYEDLSFKEIADKTGVSINTALGRMRYALINMRKMAEENNMVLNI